MRQILQNIQNGKTEIAEVPAPVVRPGHVLIKTVSSLVSIGTERILVDFGKAGWIEKARQQPEKVKQVLEKMQTDGLFATVDAVLNKLDELMSLGYCNAGVVLETGEGVRDMAPGVRIASNGPHAEIVCIPRNLCAKIPDNVPFENATFAVLGSVALQSVRLAKPELGEKYVVFGLGIVGLLAVQLLRASGCSVLAVDMSEKRLELAGRYAVQTVNGAINNVISAADVFSSGKGVDGVIIAASAKGDDIVHQAALCCRKRARIILVGVVDLNLSRNDFYEKEISFQVSCSYGPGRYDDNYEQGGHDYPFGYVRWTEQRNIQAVLELMSCGSIDVKNLITDRIAFENIASEYDRVLHDKEALGVVIDYEKRTPDISEKKIIRHCERSEDKLTSRISQFGSSSEAKRVPYTIKKAAGHAKIGIIGAGSYAKSILIPALLEAGADVMAIADINSLNASHAAGKFKTAKAVSDYRKILDDPGINTVFIVVGHHLHSRFVCESLEAGKHVFVEKPLSIDEDGLLAVKEAVLKNPDLHLMEGFNRRFSPHTIKIVKALKGRRGPLCMNMTINAGSVPAEHWIQDPLRGGGRIIGEGCHFIDLMSFIAGSMVKTVSAVMADGVVPVKDDRMCIALVFEDGSIGNINYFANGSKSYPKEILEVFSDGRVIRMDNFRKTKGYGFKFFGTLKTLKQDKGHAAESSAFIKGIENGSMPLIPVAELINVTEASFAAVKSARNREIINL
jgi:predicted dehydrogenase/threonine dehydrogenase-like Zn-dependent dehydrogenase